MLIRVDVPSTQADLWVVAADGSQPPVPYLRTTANEYQARFSADGRWVAYTSDESGRSEVYVQSFPRPGIKAAHRPPVGHGRPGAPTGENSITSTRPESLWRLVFAR